MNEERKLLIQLARRNGGVLKVDDVLDEAKDETSPLHKHFEWDDTAAADKYRRDQARYLIQKCKITLIENEPVSIRAFVSLQSDRDAGGGYRLTSEVVTDERRKQELLHDIQLTIARWTQKMHLLDGDIADLLLQLEERIKREDGDEGRAAA